MKKKKIKNRKFRTSLRIYFSGVFITTLCTACIISYSIVFTMMKLFYHGEITMPILLVISLLVCILTMFFGGVMFWFGSLHLTKPLSEISDAAKKVADGDFGVNIIRNEKRRGEYEFTNEIDELAVNFNKMTQELKGMEYIRKDFISNVSHELQTPVAAITGFTEILLEEGLEREEQQEYLLLVNKESIRLSRLCENMLRMSRLDNQQIVVKKDKVRVDEQLRKCIIMLSEKWSDKTREYELDFQELVIQSDSDLLMQIWSNLIDNAIKYSLENSTIWISGKIDGEFLTVTVKDEGKGISLDKQKKIFDKFYQCEESHKKQGNGLGLSIVKRIVELLGGTINCRSDALKGTIMEVKIPV
ncbi:HAMP domain-containing sensor histidine kinase [Clostridium sp. C2-6-12]|uniref:HAMP domain-containing sensor histidine kinase n=1 Tax=Clostridium sp. C2-6-12 TaxID=2698832 RepID=UPI0013686944|nr:HAMP domain-containing sensor histidine kinase [Clostridium sp. C2-6-12]